MDKIKNQIENLHPIINKFKFEGCFAVVTPINEGLINETYRIGTPDSNTPDYILQKINTKIFPDIEKLLANKLLVSKTLIKTKKALEFVPTIEGKYFHKDEAGGAWQASVFIRDSQTFSSAVDEAMAKEAGQAVGGFHKHTLEINPRELHTILPNFHNLSHRLAGFHSSISKSSQIRKNLAAKEIETILKEIPIVKHLDTLIESKELPIRVVHYDTKLSNILFDRNKKAICLIDYDTVMPGCWLFDFGDAVRSICNTCQEDEKALIKVEFKKNYYEKFLAGYLSEIKHILSEPEKQNLLNGAKYIILEQALRFLKDYLDGDVYYKTEYPEHNLQRAKVQLKLYQSLTEAV